MPAVVKQRTSAELSEDLRTRWAPDVAGDLELDGYAPVNTVGPAAFQPVALPRPGGGSQEVALLHPRTHVALHEVTAPLRDVTDKVLSPGVRGYRYGASSDSAHSDEYRKFRELFDEYVKSAEFVVFADVERFFPTLQNEQVKSAITATLATIELAGLFEFMDRMAAVKLPAIPPGYADARLVANLVLHQADNLLDVRFTRWVDDYRLFIPPGRDPVAVIRRLEEGLAKMGLGLNRAKTQVLDVEHARTLARDSLGSVYHPDRDPPERVRQRLRAVLAAAVQDPIRERRALRFVLPRLAKEGDEVAVPFALNALLALPWDAPRAVAYLGRFADRTEVRDGIDGAVRVAATRRDSWLLARLAPLALRITLSASTLDALRDALVHLAPSPAWGLTLRVLAVNARHHDVEQAIEGPIPDVRAALIALQTLESPIPDELARTEPVLASRLGRETTPLPAIDSLL
jgi:hypothetical protein